LVEITASALRDNYRIKILLLALLVKESGNEEPTPRG
jgi:hypothetical protein